MKNLLVVFAVLAMISCKKDTINPDDYAYSRWEHPSTKNELFYTTDSYRNKYNPLSDHFIKATVDFSTFPRLPQNYKMRITWRDDKPYDMDEKPEGTIRNFQFRYNDYIKDSSHFRVEFFLDQDSVPFEVYDRYLKFPVR